MHQQHTQLARPLMVRTHRGQQVVVRQATLADTVLLAELLCRLSERTRYLRYMSSPRFSAEAIWSEAVRMTRGHSPDHTTLVATIQRNEHNEAIAVAELVRYRRDRSVGELAVLVHDDEQQQGIGSFLLRYLVGIAQRSDIKNLSASMLVENRAMLRLIRSLGLPYSATTSYGETQVLVSLPVQQEENGFAHAAHTLAA